MPEPDLRLIDTLYAAIEQDGAWVSALEQMKVQFAAESAVVQVLHTGAPKLRELWTMRDHLSQERAPLHDSWANSAANPRFDRPRETAPLPGIGSDFRSLPLSRADQETMRRGLAGCGLGPAFWLDVALSETTHFSLIFHRAPGDERDLAPAEEAGLRALMPHMHRVARLWQRLHRADDRALLLEQACTAADVATLVCDARLAVRWANAPAQRLLANGQGLRCQQGRLAGARTADHARLRAMVEAALAGQRGALSVGEAGAGLYVQALPAQDSGIADNQQVLLLISAPHLPPAIDPQALGPAFGLTMAEARVVAALTQGLSLGQFAASRGIAEATARVQLKSALAKTGAARQADLVRMVCNTTGLRLI